MFNRRSPFCRTVACSCLLAIASPASAQPRVAERSIRPPKLDQLQPSEWVYPEFSLGEMIATGTGFATALTLAIVGPRGDKRYGGVWFDDSARDALRATSIGGQRFARDVSDVFLTTLLSYPLLVDAVLVAGWYKRDRKLAIQLTLINLEVQAISAAIHGIATVTVRRERPYAADCGIFRPGDTRDCTGNIRYVSFFSGHTSQSFAAAAANCSHHLNLSLYGGGYRDIVPCVGGLAMAAATGMLRIVGDMHYATDVLTGALVGTLVGFGVPWLLHYRQGKQTQAQTAELAGWRLLPTPTGVAAVGWF